MLHKAGCVQAGIRLMSSGCRIICSYNRPDKAGAALMPCCVGLWSSASCQP